MYPGRICWDHISQIWGNNRFPILQVTFGCGSRVGAAVRLSIIACVSPEASMWTTVDSPSCRSSQQQGFQGLGFEAVATAQLHCLTRRAKVTQVRDASTSKHTTS